MLATIQNVSRASIAAALALGLLVAPAAFGDSVRLKASVRLPAGADQVRLGDIAVLTGAEAEALAEIDVAVVDDMNAIMEIPIRDVRARLEEAGVHWGRVNLSGSRVIVRPRPISALPAPGAMQSISIATKPDRRGAQARAPKDDRLAADLIALPTLRGRIAREMTQGLNADASALRIAFDRADAERLDTLEDTRRFELEPHNSFQSDVVTFTARSWSGGRITDTWNITVRPLLRMDTAVLLRDLRRSEPIAGADFEVRERWLPPTQALVACRPSEVSGRITSSRLETGTVIKRKHVRRRNIVARGDRLMIRCLVGGVVIALQAEAREDGAVGDIIEVRKLGERQTFLATISRRGEAVVDLSR